MHPHRPHLPFLLLALGSLSCGDTGIPNVRYPLLARGAPAAPFTVGEYTVELEVAELAFGPLYLCATSAASSDLCPSAVSEFADSAVIDLLDGERQALGDVVGFAGEVRSATFDYGITWLSTQRVPTATVAAIAGHSLHVEGTASRDGDTLRFLADLDLTPQAQGTRTVQGARVQGEGQATATSLTLTFDPQRWWAQVDFEELSALAAMTPDETLVLPKGSRAASALTIAITANYPPEFIWSQTQ